METGLFAYIVNHSIDCPHIGCENCTLGSKLDSVHGFAFISTTRQRGAATATGVAYIHIGAPNKAIKFRYLGSLAREFFLAILEFCE